MELSPPLSIKGPTDKNVQVPLLLSLPCFPFKKSQAWRCARPKANLFAGTMQCLHAQWASSLLSCRFSSPFT